MLTRRKLIALGLVAAVVIGIGPLAQEGLAQSGCTVTRGAALGNWDLPPAGPGSLGAIDGDLFLNGMAVYRMTGAIMEQGLACPSCRGGTFFATLDDGIGIGPDYVVSGTWFGDFLSGQGTWQGTIFKNVGPAQIPVGRMRGAYNDPMAVPDPIGTFGARWVICD